MKRKKVPEVSTIIPPNKKRTTIYLPFALNKPTKAIRQKINSLIPEVYIKNWFKYYELKSKEMITLDIAIK